MWRFGSLPWRLTRVIGRGLGVLSSRGIRWRHGLLSWISASLTRRTVVTATGTGPTNHCLQRVTSFILPISLLWVCIREVIAYCFIRLTSLLDYYCWFASSYLPSWSYYLAAINLRTLMLFHTWLWLACCSLSSAAYQLGCFYCLSSKLPSFEDFHKNRLFTPPLVDN